MKYSESMLIKGLLRLFNDGKRTWRILTLVSGDRGDGASQKVSGDGGGNDKLSCEGLKFLLGVLGIETKNFL